MKRSLLTLPLLAAMLAMPARGDDEPSPIRLNTVGYLPLAAKKATIASPCSRFRVIRLSGGQAVLSGKVSGPVLDPDTQQQVCTADFSGLIEPGLYALDVPDVGRSAPFRIAADVYHDPFYVVTRGMYLWRCGTAVSATNHGSVFAHGPCHTNDAWLDFVGGGHTRKDSTGGWHDAGDYNKYVVNAGVTVGALFRAWEDFGGQIRRVRLDIPESGGSLPDFLAEVKWEMDWLLTMQAEDGSVYHKVTTKRFGPFVLPELETEERYITPWGTEATADFVAMTAQAARIYRPYDSAYADRCLQAANKSYRFLKEHPEYHRADLTGFRTGSYETMDRDHRLHGGPNNRLWAAAELWETTGDFAVLSDLELGIRSVQGQVDVSFDWQDAKSLGLFTYVLSGRIGRDPALVQMVRSNMLAVADEIVKTGASHAYARPLGTNYYWGCNGTVARQALVLMVADRLTSPSTPPGSKRGAQLLLQPGVRPAGKPEYRAACLDAVSHLFGRNCYGRSFVTGVGFRPPMHPHDRRSGGDNVEDPWPGYLVGGAHPKAADWKDVQGDARTNEIAINWNGALIYALAACLGE